MHEPRLRHNPGNNREKFFVGWQRQILHTYRASTTTVRQSKDLLTPKNSTRAPMTEWNHHHPAGIAKNGITADLAHSRKLVVKNATDWATMRNIAVSPNTENHLSRNNKRKYRKPIRLKGNRNKLFIRKGSSTNQSQAEPRTLNLQGEMLGKPVSLRKTLMSCP